MAVTLISCSALADEFAMTESGQRVLLRDNGTWALANVPPQNSGGNVDAVIKRKCLREWPTDFQMQAYCIRQQNDAVRALSRGKPADIAEGQFTIVRDGCASEWPTDFQMREYCERQQYDSIRSLR